MVETSNRICCCNLRTAAYIVAFVEVLLCILCVYGLIHNFQLFGATYLLWFIVGIISVIIIIVAIIVLLYGIKKDKPRYLLPHLSAQVFLIAFLLIVALIVLLLLLFRSYHGIRSLLGRGDYIMSDDSTRSIGTILVLVYIAVAILEIFFLWIVWKLYKYLKEYHKLYSKDPFAPGNNITRQNWRTAPVSYCLTDLHYLCTGIGQLDIMKNAVSIDLDTPFGKPSAPIIRGEIDGVIVVLLSRHGDNHEYSPSAVNYRANIWALKELKCDVIIASAASGSLKEEIAPGHMVVVDDFIDRTTKREQTFYDGKEHHPKNVCHIPMVPAFEDKLRNILIESIKEIEVPVHTKGTIVCIEGPRFSSRAESKMYRLLGGDVINMTVVPEVVLCKELGIPYAVIALITDYDSWKETDKAVDVTYVLETLKLNSANSLKVFLNAIKKLRNADFTLVSEGLQMVAKMSVM
uniref:S-methyl-5'-thioadenosine phosphorylase n=1 Tax=Rhabditophanes sp. KR3021 TaxID=114890 RepID=A0AC35TH85_9BILA